MSASSTSSEQASAGFRHERKLWRSGVYYVAGVDEAGRGPLAGPVVAAAVLVTPGFEIEGVEDSKTLAPAERERLCALITAGAPSVGVGIVDHETIDRVNILNATFLAMHRAIAGLKPRPQHVLVDGNRFTPGEDGVPYTTLVGGDARSFSIAAASIVAKVTRDRIMLQLDSEYPAYGFCRHKGYATPEHRAAILKYGLCPVHRRSFTIRWQLELSL
ncbi:MAG: ribonuclease [Bacteroidetes bacterium]|nr:ribonuclease [Bacteroidota bacterium]